ncbi:uncharacterized protein N7483_006585 [Penicillium malachiteum]|uniref:uncharacterized protein n=1 Tax=Penicillium malachiteum TaxID=1324776 RepID=UPI002547E912|nr:uncharacterized protein N7483_006585 [Penicillium malachiteum]KAJ5725228.1 hypothetical protein N7483_006585 [Penicillium malachiteum]
MARKNPESQNAHWNPPLYEEIESQYPAQVPAPNPDTAATGLCKFDTIFIIDDSTSMKGNRWEELEKAIAVITPLCTQGDEDGIEIYFLNHNQVYENVKKTEKVQEIFSDIHPDGWTPVGEVLRKILEPYLARVQNMQRYRQSHWQITEVPASVNVKPLNIIVITDGAFTDGHIAQDTIFQTASALDKCDPPARSDQLGIQFFQIGDDEKAKKFLENLDDNLGKICGQEKMRDIVDTVTWEETEWWRSKKEPTLDTEWLLKVVLGGVNKVYDQKTRKSRKKWYHAFRR